LSRILFHRGLLDMSEFQRFIVPSLIHGSNRENPLRGKRRAALIPEHHALAARVGPALQTAR
jgi:hypothetical protein